MNTGFSKKKETKQNEIFICGKKKTIPAKTFILCNLLDGIDQIPIVLQVTHLAIWGSIFAWFVFLAIYSRVWPIIGLAPEMYGQVGPS